MAGGKETPRQKMIGMMYLVLTALLALNVSAEVLEAFQNITVGIEETMEVTEAKNIQTFQDLRAKVGNMEGDENAALILKRAKEAQTKIETLEEYLQNIKVEIVETESGGQSYNDPNDPESYVKLEKLKDPKNIDVATRLLVEKQPGGGEPKGVELKQKINQTREELVNLFDGLAGVTDEYKAQLDKSLTLRAEDNEDAKELPKRDWEYATFNSVPRGAAVALITKLQNDAKNAEAEIVTRLFKSLSAGKYEVGELIPVVKSNKSAVAVGEKYEAKVFLSAKIGAVEPVITVEGKEIKTEAAVGQYEDIPGSQGSRKKKGKISVLNPNTGKTEEYPFEINYDVFKAPAIISADKMNVVYQGLDNPISISVPGFEPDKIIASMTPGDAGKLVKKGDGKYIAKITRRKRDGVNINVSVNLPGGKSKRMGSANFRTMKVPSPTASLNGNQGPNITTGELGAVRIVSVTLENFVFEGIRYKVSQFDYIYKPTRGQLQRGTAQGQAIPGNLKAQFSGAKRGDLLIISGIKAKAPGLGAVPLAGSLVYTVQ